MQGFQRTWKDLSGNVLKNFWSITGALSDTDGTEAVEIDGSKLAGRGDSWYLFDWLAPVPLSTSVENLLNFKVENSCNKKVGEEYFVTKVLQKRWWLRQNWVWCGTHWRVSSSVLIQGTDCCFDAMEKSVRYSRCIKNCLLTYCSIDANCAQRAQGHHKADLAEPTPSMKKVTPGSFSRLINEQHVNWEKEVSTVCFYLSNDHYNKILEEPDDRASILNKAIWDADILVYDRGKFILCHTHVELHFQYNRNRKAHIVALSSYCNVLTAMLSRSHGATKTWEQIKNLSKASNISVVLYQIKSLDNW